MCPQSNSDAVSHKANSSHSPLKCEMRETCDVYVCKPQIAMSGFADDNLNEVTYPLHLSSISLCLLFCLFVTLLSDFDAKVMLKYILTKPTNILNGWWEFIMSKIVWYSDLPTLLFFMIPNWKFVMAPACVSDHCTVFYWSCSYRWTFCGLGLLIHNIWLISPPHRHCFFSKNGKWHKKVLD